VRSVARSVGRSVDGGGLRAGARGRRRNQFAFARIFAGRGQHHAAHPFVLAGDAVAHCVVGRKVASIGAAQGPATRHLTLS